MNELVQAYDDYIRLLVEYSDGLAGLAFAHGYVCPPEMVSRGEECRAKIAELQRKLSQ